METTPLTASPAKHWLAARWRWYRYKLGLLADRTFPPLERFRERQRLITHYTRAHGKPPRLDPPTTFNEKIIAASLTDRHPLLALCSDKIAVRAYVAARIGEEWVLPLLGAWWRAEDVDWDALPDAFVLKPSHSSGQILKVDNKARLDHTHTIATLHGWLAIDYYRQGPGEWRYRDIPPRILAEPLLPNAPDGGSPPDVKVFMFEGEPLVMQVMGGRHRAPDADVAASWFDCRTLAFLPIRQKRRQHFVTTLPPEIDLDTLFRLCRALAADFHQVRVDFLPAGSRLWFTELTFTDFAGCATFDPPEWDERLGAAWPLRNGQAYFVRPGVPAPTDYPPRRT